MQTEIQSGKDLKLRNATIALCSYSYAFHGFALLCATLIYFTLPCIASLPRIALHCLNVRHIVRGRCTYDHKISSPPLEEIRTRKCQRRPQISRTPNEACMGLTIRWDAHLTNTARTCKMAARASVNNNLAGRSVDRLVALSITR